MRLYWEQRPLHLYAPGSNEPYFSADGLSLFVLWDFDHFAEQITGLDLVKGGDWRIGVEHPATAAVASHPSQEVEVFEDLEFEEDRLDEAQDEEDEGIGDS